MIYGFDLFRKGMYFLLTCKHKRKDGYWLCYYLAHTLERDMFIENIVSLVKENFFLL